MVGVITGANFGVEKVKGLVYTRFKIWHLPLKQLVTLTTVSCHRAACDAFAMLSRYLDSGKTSKDWK